MHKSPIVGENTVEKSPCVRCSQSNLTSTASFIAAEKKMNNILKKLLTDSDFVRNPVITQDEKEVRTETD